MARRGAVARSDALQVTLDNDAIGSARLHRPGDLRRGRAAGLGRRGAVRARGGPPSNHRRRRRRTAARGRRADHRSRRRQSVDVTLEGRAMTAVGPSRRRSGRLPHGGRSAAHPRRTVAAAGRRRSLPAAWAARQRRARQRQRRRARVRGRSGEGRLQGQRGALAGPDGDSRQRHYDRSGKRRPRRPRRGPLDARVRRTARRSAARLRSATTTRSGLSAI